MDPTMIIDKNSDEFKNIKDLFSKTTNVLTAIGDSTRQHIILSMMELPCELEGGSRVGEITAKTNLSRPAISHHLKILKESGIVNLRKKGTMNFYSLAPEQKDLEELKNLLDRIITLTQKLNIKK